MKPFERPKRLNTDGARVLHGMYFVQLFYCDPYPLFRLLRPCRCISHPSSKEGTLVDCQCIYLLPARYPISADTPERRQFQEMNTSILPN